MASKKVTFRIEEDLLSSLEQAALNSRMTESALLREILRHYLAENNKMESFFAAASRAGIIGASKKLPRDLSTNKKYLSGFGE